MLLSAGTAAAETARIEAVLAGIQTAAVIAFATPNAWPETVRAAVEGSSLTVQLRGVQHVPAVGSQRATQRGVVIDGMILVRRINFGILGEGQNSASAQMIYAAMLFDTIDWATVAYDVVNDPSRDAKVTVGPCQIVNTAGDGRTDLAMLIPWSVRMVLTLGQIANLPATTQG